MEAYTEISFLQNGNMTWIFKAKDITSRDVVFKVFFPRYIANIIFKYERRILLKITSIPQVQKYIDDFAIPTETLNTLLPNFKNSLSEGEFILDKCLVLVMEFAPGMDLFESLKAKIPVPINLFFQTMTQILSDLHQNRIQHRDIKMENIVYDPNTKQFTLIDFGSAGSSTDLQSDKVYVCLTHGYYKIPRDNYSEKFQDNYAVMVCLYELIHNHSPWNNLDGSYLGWENQTILTYQEIVEKYLTEKS